MDAPLHRPRLVMLTRAAVDSEETAALVRARGLTPVAAPLFSVVARTLPAPAGIQARLVTSRNALPALHPAGLLLTVGDATAAQARALGFAAVQSAGGDATDLAALAAARLDPAGGPLLLATGAGQGRALAADLRRRGFRVVRRVCYEVRPVRRFPAAGLAALSSGRLRAVLFLSAETASCFVRLLPPECNDMLATVEALVIGKTTADALDGLPWLRICRAPTPTLDGVLALL